MVSAGVAHDLRNAFMVILGFAETILQDGSLSADARSGLERVGWMAKLGSDMSHQLARHGADAKLELSPDDLGAIASSVAPRRAAPASASTSAPAAPPGPKLRLRLKTDTTPRIRLEPPTGSRQDLGAGSKPIFRRGGSGGSMRSRNVENNLSIS